MQVDRLFARRIELELPLARLAGRSPDALPFLDELERGAQLGRLDGRDPADGPSTIPREDGERARPLRVESRPPLIETIAASRSGEDQRARERLLERMPENVANAGIDPDPQLRLLGFVAYRQVDALLVRDHSRWRRLDMQQLCELLRRERIRKLDQDVGVTGALVAVLAA